MECPVCRNINPDQSDVCLKCGSRLSAAGETAVMSPKTSLLPKIAFDQGAVIAHRYRIMEKIGGGGMGVVYKVEDTKLKRIVALKFLPPELTNDPEYKQRFIQEAQAASRLNHHNIYTVHEIDVAEAGYLYIAMAYYEGETLKKKIKRGPLPLREAIDYTIQIVDGLAEAHKNDIVHRDIKPANIMITKDGIVKILDFGLAKLGEQTRITRPSTLMGTVAYMSPEQALGETVSFPSDIWSTGVMLYELLTGGLPFRGEKESAVLYSIVNRSPIPLKDLKEDIPWDLERIVLKCLKKDIDKRYRSCEALLHDLKVLRSQQDGKKAAGAGGDADTRKEIGLRHVTAIFVRLSGYIEMLQTMSEEKVASVMHRCLRVFDALERTSRAQIEKITDRSFKIFFGLSSVVEEAPKKALESAVALRNQIHQFNETEHLQIPLDIHIGIDTGPVVVDATGEGPGREYEITGDLLELASSLMELAPKGKIWVGPNAYKATRSHFDFKQVHSAVIKEHKEPLPVFELISGEESPLRPKRGPDRVISSPMVGRDKELDRLEYHLLKVINGEGSIVNVVGEAGIGKSRLIDEFKKKDALKKVTLLEGRALSAGKNLSFHPIMDLIRRWAGIREGDSALSASDKLETVIRQVHPEGADEAFPFIGTLMGMKLLGKAADRIKGIEGGGLEKLILKNMRDLFAKAAQRNPVVFIIEDLHWADLSSIELLESIFRLAESHAIFFINVFRPRYEDTSDRILNTVRERYERVNAEIVLESLDENESDALIHNLLRTPSLPHGVRTLLHQRAEGNPFFIEEVLRSFIDSGVVEYEDGAFKFTKKIDSVDIPETINGVLMARIDNLEEKTKSLLKVAAVIGKSFFYRILADVAKPAEEIDEKLEYLKEIQLIRDRRIKTELEYFFKHALTQEVAYDSILPEKRKELHLKVARSIESVFAGRLPEFYGMLAFHYSLGDDPEKAEFYLIKAGEEALKAAASWEAINYYQDALNLYVQKRADSADREKLAKLENNIATALFNKGRMAEAVEHFDKVLKYWGEKTPRNRISAVLGFLGNMLNVIRYLYVPPKKDKKPPQVRDNERILLGEKKGLALTSVDHYKMFMDSVGLLKILNRLDLAKVEKGVPIYAGMSAIFSYTGISFKISEKILHYAKRYLDANDTKAVFNYKFYELTHNFPSGRWESDFGYDDQFVDLNIQKGEVFVAAGLSLWSGILILEQGNFATALKCIAKLNEIGEVYENDYARARRIIVNTKLLIKQRKLPEALASADAAIRFLEKVGQNLGVLGALGMKAYVQILLGNEQGADVSLSQARDMARHERRIAPFFLNDYLMSQFLLDLVRLEKAVLSKDRSRIRHFKKKSSLSGKAALKKAMKYAAAKTEAFRLEGVRSRLLGKPGQALRWWDKSLDVGERLNARPELARTYFEIGRRLSQEPARPPQRKGMSAEESFEKARRLFQQMELDWDLKELAKTRSS
jgi:class 3 adenylate cyclase/tetratricopeptide (TPR) repeat protein